ncbi:Transglycosylase SLT domain protein [uncultured archaeon]|nr:Transglycosylase SLT domain protein [uncultured archaeon]
MKKLLFVIFMLCSAAAWAQDIYDNAELVTGCPAWILRGIAGTESGYNPAAVGDDGISVGMFQINERYHDERARKYGEYNPYNSEQAVLIAGYIMADNIRRLSDILDAIAAYRQGVTGVRKHGRTEWYVNKVYKYGVKKYHE